MTHHDSPAEGDMATMSPSGREVAIENLTIAFGGRDGVVATEGVSFVVKPGELVTIIGPSGCGKSTVLNAIASLVPKSQAEISGQIRIGGEPVDPYSSGQTSRGLGYVFQRDSLLPWRTVAENVAMGLEIRDIGGSERRDRVAELLDMVGLTGFEDYYPHQISGGMRQRVMIAMALLCRPGLLIADEPTTALDVTVQAQILELLRSLQREFQLGILLITHDLGVVSALCEEALVMYAGRRMEAGATHDLLRMPTHPYTRGLLDSLPHLDTPVSQRLEPIPGQPPDLGRAPTGCVFANRCPFAVDACSRSAPSMQRAANRWRACHRSVQEITEATIA